ncbi:MAG TPA: farnesyl diphosphate synthase [Gemmataceae bacterium]|nr:farnesyl diphosphate synthase [Gemmataceae bacterium]
MTDDLSQYLADKQALVEDELRNALRLGEDCPPALLEAMRYSLLAGGKRLRPLLVLMAAEACGGRDADALPAACAVEMIHTYSLIHDDLPAMDDDDLRRGQPTCHKRFGEALAILAGDALLTLAFEVLAVGYPPPTAAACCRELARAAGAAGMVGGQVEDLAWERPEPAGCRSHSLEALENLHARKTGALFRACLRLGACSVFGERAAGPNWERLQSLDQYGRCFGQAFQITDDLLDVEGNSAETGKRVQKDAGRGKFTYPGFLGVAESRVRAEQLCQEARRQLLPFGEAGARLAQLTFSLVDRKR